VALQEVRVIVPKLGGKNRDEGKAFLLKEMTAYDAEYWGGEIGDLFIQYGLAEVVESGMAGVAQNIGKVFNSGGRIPFAEAHRKTERLMQCVYVIPDKSKPDFVRQLHETDIEDPDTRIWLKRQVLELHVNFSTLLSRLVAALGLSSTTLASSLSDTQTSPTPSPPAYRPARHQPRR